MSRVRFRCAGLGHLVHGSLNRYIHVLRYLPTYPLFYRVRACVSMRTGNMSTLDVLATRIGEHILFYCLSLLRGCNSPKNPAPPLPVSSKFHRLSIDHGCPSTVFPNMWYMCAMKKTKFSGFVRAAARSPFARLRHVAMSSTQSRPESDSRSFTQLGHDCGLPTFLLVICQQITSMDDVKDLVKKCRAFGNGIRKVCTNGDQIVGLSVAVRSRASVKAVWAQNQLITKSSGSASSSAFCRSGIMSVVTPRPSL